MINKKDKNAVRRKRHQRVRNKISGTDARPRLCVYRSNKEIYAQVIDDVAGVTLASANTMEKDIAAQVKGKSKVDAAKIVGETVAKRAKAKKIETVVFDRSGYLYTGRVEALATGAREAGLNF
jgi:large subunit ribosomal protein L18